MSIYLCAVTARFPENYHIGLQAHRWGVEERYAKKIQGVRKGDSLVFLVGGEYRSIHQVESDPITESNLLWPIKDGSVFPYRIVIGPAICRGHVLARELAHKISFMRFKERWQGTLQGAHGVLNPRLTVADLDIIRASMLRGESEQTSTRHDLTVLPAFLPKPVESPPARKASRVIPFDAGSAELLSTLQTLLPGLGLRVHGSRLLLESGIQKGAATLLCLDASGGFVVVVIQCGQPPTDILLHLLHDMSLVRQQLAGPKTVKGIVVSEGSNDALSSIIGEVPNVTLCRFRRTAEIVA